MGYKTKKTRCTGIEHLAWRHVIEGKNLNLGSKFIQKTHYSHRMISMFGKKAANEAIRKALEMKQMVCPPQTSGQGSGTITGRVVNFNPPMHQIRGVTATHVIIDEFCKL